MEKLIELLDKFRRENKTKELIGEPWTLVPLTWKDFIELNRVMIISKEYGFIEWLVENDKIKDYYEWNDDIDYVREKYWFYEALLMLLSISSTPIEFLISILR